MIAALENLRNSPTEIIDTRENAELINNVVEKFNFLTLSLSEQINSLFDHSLFYGQIQKILHTEGILTRARTLVRTLTNRLNTLKNFLSNNITTKGKTDQFRRYHEKD